MTRSVFVSVANLDLERAAAAARGLGRRRACSRRATCCSIRRRGPTSIIDDVAARRRRRRGPARRPPMPDRRDRARPARRRRPGLGDRPARSARGRSSSSATGDPYLETALSLPPELELFGVNAGRLRSGRRAAPATARPWDLIIFEGVLPGDAADARRSSRSRPPQTSPLGDGHRHARRTRGSARSTRTSRSCATSTSRRSTSPRPRKLDAARLGADGHPGTARARRCSTPASATGVPTAVLAFEPRRSDLPLQVAFPILLANLTGELMGGSRGAGRGGQARRPGQPADPGRARRGCASSGRTGRSSSSCPGRPGGASVTFAQTDLLGRLLGHAAIRAGASAAPSGSPASPSPRPTPTAAATPGASGGPGAGAGAAVDPNAPIRFAVDLFDVDESTIAPGSAAALESARRDAGASAHPAPRRRRVAGRRVPPDRPATSCGSRSSCSSWSACASSGRVYHRDVADPRAGAALGAPVPAAGPDGSA